MGTATVTVQHTQYAWSGRAGFGVSAQTAGEIVEAISSDRGVCTPQDLVDSARPVTHPLHPAFEWNDHVAAEKWRVTQARDLISCIRVAGSPEAPAFVHLRVEAGQEGYVRLSVALADTETSEYVLREALAALEGLRARYSAIKSLSPVWVALKKVKSSPG